MDLGKARSTSDIGDFHPTVKIPPGHVMNEDSLEVDNPLA
jgi:hypothetical protein